MVHGSCLILTKALLGYQPLLDENVFLYWEEAILSDLVIAKGLKVWFDPELIVYHGWGKSTGSKLKAKHLDRSTKYYFESVQKIGFAGKAYLRAYLAALRFVRFVRADLT
jgi:GT2 family glycosyltransferase